MNGTSPFDQIIELTILCIALSVFFLGLLVMFFLFWKSNRSHQKELMELGRYSTNVQAIIDKNIPNLLHEIIEDCFNDYDIMVLTPRNELYITDEREREIRNDLVQKVVNRLSPMALDKLSLFYNVHKIDEIIAEKVYITVMNYVVAHNAMITDKARLESQNRAEPKK